MDKTVQQFIEIFGPLQTFSCIKTGKIYNSEEEMINDKRHQRLQNIFDDKNIKFRNEEK